MASDIEAGRTAAVWARVEKGETVEGLLESLWDYWHVLISQIPAPEALNLVRYLSVHAPARELVLLSLERLRAVSPMERAALIDVLAAALPRLQTQRWRFILQCTEALAPLVRHELSLSNPPPAEHDSDEDDSNERNKEPRFEANVLNDPTKSVPTRDTTTAVVQWQSQLRLLQALQPKVDSDIEIFLVRGLAFKLLADAITLYLPVDVESIVAPLLEAASEPHLIFSPEASSFAPNDEEDDAENSSFTPWCPEGLAYAAALLLPRLPVVLSPLFIFQSLEPHVNSLLKIPFQPSPPSPESTRLQPADPHKLGEELYTSLLRPLIGRDPLLTLPPISDKALEQQTSEAGRLQALINFIVNCHLQARRTALWKGVRGQVSLYDDDTRLRLIRFLLRHCPYGHVAALLLGWVKDEIARTPAQPAAQTTNVFVRELRSFFPLVFQALRPGAELEHFDQLMAGVNFARFLLLWDKNKVVLNDDALRELSDIFLEPLRLSLVAQLASPLPNITHRNNLQVIADVCDRTLELLRPVVV